MGHKVFVYGTLRTSGVNGAVLEGQKFLGKAVTKDAKFKIYEVPSRNYDYPALVNSDEGYKVFGEAYEINDKCIDLLDKIEGVAHGLYSRQTVSVILETGEEVEVILYCYQRDLKGLEHVGPCWPMHELVHYKIVDKNLIVKKQDVQIGQVRLRDTKQDRWASPPFDTEEELNNWAKKQSGRVGGDATRLWNTNCFKVEKEDGTRPTFLYQLVDQNKTPIGEPCISLSALADFAEKECFLFGGDKATAAQWSDLFHRRFGEAIKEFLDEE